MFLFLIKKPSDECFKFLFLRSIPPLMVSAHRIEKEAQVLRSK